MVAIAGGDCWLLLAPCALLARIESRKSRQQHYWIRLFLRSLASLLASPRLSCLLGFRSFATFASSCLRRLLRDVACCSQIGRRANQSGQIRNAGGVFVVCLSMLTVESKSLITCSQVPNPTLVRVDFMISIRAILRRMMLVSIVDVTASLLGNQIQFLLYLSQQGEWGNGGD